MPMIGSLSGMPAAPEPATMTAPEPATAVEIVDLFAGPGGLDVAARELGRSVIGIELDADACTTRVGAGLGTISDDVRKHGPEEFPEATILTGGPPCQTYSVAGNGVGRKALDTVLEFANRIAKGDYFINEFDELDLRTGLVLQPLRWALTAFDNKRPYEVIVLEQVPAVLPVWKAVGASLEKLGYSVASGVLHAEEFGVPQTRRRAILVAKRGSQARLPSPTHRSYRKGRPREEGDASLKPWVSMGEALKRSDAFTVVSNYGTGGDPALRGERRSTQPAATVTSKIFRNRVISADGTSSRFTVAEAGLLQTFPRNYPWAGRDVAKQIGNAIPPLLARRVLEEALDLVPAVQELIPHQVSRRRRTPTSVR